MTIPYLPPEILTNIFLRLPIETLSNIIFLDKLCFQLISSPDFGQAHLIKQDKANLSSYRFMFPTMSADIFVSRFLKQFPIAPLLGDESSSINIVDLDYPKNGVGVIKADVLLVGSCNGLVCIVLNNKHVFLWNPCTGKYKKLPRPCVDVRKKIDLNVTYGFGYDEFTDDYKVVLLRSFTVKSLMACHHEAFVFSLKRGAWKRIVHDGSGNVSCYPRGKVVSGKVHWLSHDYYNGDPIVSFDLGTEVFGRVEEPSNYEGGVLKTTLDELEGCICLLFSYEQPEHVDLWVMKEYGMKESWIKMVTVSCVNMLSGCSLGATTVLPNGEIFLGSKEYFLVYNPKDKSFRLFRGKRGWQYLLNPVIYVQSLISPVV